MGTNAAVLKDSLDRPVKLKLMNVKAVRVKIMERAVRLLMGSNVTVLKVTTELTARQILMNVVATPVKIMEHAMM